MQFSVPPQPESRTTRFTEQLATSIDDLPSSSAMPAKSRSNGTVLQKRCRKRIIPHDARPPTRVLSFTQRTWARRRSGEQLFETTRRTTKDRACHYKAAKRARERKEKERKKAHFSGIAWGYDPDAGLVETTVQDEQRGCFMFPGLGSRGIKYGTEEFNGLGRRTGRVWYQGNKWGIEARSPRKIPGLSYPSTAIK